MLYIYIYIYIYMCYYEPIMMQCDKLSKLNRILFIILRPKEIWN